MLKSIRPRIVELGKIKIGRKEARVRQSARGGDWRAPEKLDHFLITTLQRNEKGDLVEDRAVMDQLLLAQGGGDKLREIPIELLSDDIDDVLVARHCYYGSKKLWGWCDEVNCTWLVDKQGNALPEPRMVPCNGEHSKKPAEGEKSPWKVHATLNCVVAAGVGSTIGGVYRFRTTSQISLEQLYGGLVHIQALTRGVLQGLPLKLVVRPLQVAPNGQTTTVYVVHVELRGRDLAGIQEQAAQLTQARVTNARQIEAARAEYRKMLRAPGEAEPLEEQEETADEFHPEAHAGSPVIDTTAAPQLEAPSMESSPEAEAAYNQSVQHARDLPQDRQIEEDLDGPPGFDEPPHEIAAVPAVDLVLKMIETAANNGELATAYRAAQQLTPAEKERIKKPYNAKFELLNPKPQAAANGAP